MSDHSDTESFKSAHEETSTYIQTGKSNPDPSRQNLDSKLERLPADQETSLLETSNAHKSHANALFADAHYSDAIQIYDKALASLPAYFDFEIAVLRCNIAACHLKLGEWEDVIEAATGSVEGLVRVDPTLKPKKEAEDDEGGGVKGEERNGGVAVQEVDDEMAARIEELERSGRAREEVLKIWVKALMRRAKAREEIGGWAALQGAAEDYKDLAGVPSLSSLDLKTVRQAQRRLPPMLEAAKQREMGEMMGKLKELGNGFLKPFGLSTDNFQFTKDEKTGGYGMQYNQGSRDSGGR